MVGRNERPAIGVESFVTGDLYRVRRAVYPKRIDLQVFTSH